ncbi:small GTP-binding protein [Histomonas meleagridis]|uniref:small GTP-binding protein n=1 Tax=Histomonas meleagridis TaxID=135588 RepID=UPI003559C088|nr:small GTP-binding protein [Histomonas meleagridis]KAH0804241.1 small GTP-binding protein [Histomonas meleagridis]
MMDSEEVYKVVLVGSSGVGKTSLVQKYHENNFSGEVQPTVGAAYVRCKIMIDEENEVTINIWDTAGQEKFQSLIPLYLRNANACIFVFDMSLKDPLAELQKLNELVTNNVDPDCLIFMAGNKIDLIDEQGKEQKIKLIQESSKINQCKFFMTSAKTGDGVDQLFKNIAEDLYNSAKNTTTQKKSNILSEIISEDEKPKEKCQC